MNASIKTDTPPPADECNDDTLIWRYMDLPRFISMLTTSRLWFAKAASFHDDPYEGFCKVQHPQIPGEEDGPKVVIQTTDGEKSLVSVNEMHARIRRDASRVYENARDHLYVNSWCLASESMAMWQVYSSLTEGMAVKSSVGQYRRAARFAKSFQVRFGQVKYHSDIESSPEIQRDFRTGPVPLSSKLQDEVLQLGFNKRSCY